MNCARPAALAHELQTEREQQGEEQHLQHLALGEGADHGGGDDVRDVVPCAHVVRLGDVGLDAAGIDGLRIDVHARAGLPEVHHQQADHQGERGRQLEIQQCLQPDAADLLHVLHAGDAVHHGAEDDRADHHLDGGDEHVAERLQAGAGGGEEIADQDAEDDRTEHLDIEVVMDRAGGLGGGGGGHARLLPARAGAAVGSAGRFTRAMGCVRCARFGGSRGWSDGGLVGWRWSWFATGAGGLQRWGGRRGGHENICKMGNGRKPISDGAI